MRLVACNNSVDFYDWLKFKGYPDLEATWGIGLLDACFKYWVKDERPLHGTWGAVWYHWGEAEDALVVHICATPGLNIFDRQLMGDFYKVPELLGARYLIAHMNMPGIGALAKFAGWTPNEHGSYIIDLPSPWARYDPGVKGRRDGQDTRPRGRREGPGHLEAGSEDRGGSQEGGSRKAGTHEPASGTIGAAAPGP